MSMQRILRIPLPAEEGGEAGDDELVTISRRELDQLRANASLTTSNLPGESQNRPVLDRRADRTPTVENELEFAVSTGIDERNLAREKAYRTALLERELATVLAEQQLVAGAAAQLIKLWRDDLDVYEDEGTLRIVAKDGRTVVQAVTDWLASPDYSHFSRALSRGGSGAKGVNTTPTAPVNQQPRSLGDEILRQWKESKLQPNPTGGRMGWGRSHSSMS